jgi:DNA modification methylase
VILGRTSRDALNVSALDAREYPRHRWYFYKEAFSPHLVRHAIEAEELPRTAEVFDPFSGSGTTVLEAASLGRAAYGYEVNPFVAAVARAKLCRASPSEFRSAASVALNGAIRGRRSKLDGFSTFSERGGSAKWLFNAEVLRAFSGAWHSVRAKRGCQYAALRIALIGAAMDCSNARKDGKCLRYRSDWRHRKLGIGDFLESLGRRVAIMADDLDRAPVTASALISVGDARVKIPHRPFSLCVTSPPYLNSFDYTDVYRPELFLGEFVSNMAELAALRRRTVRSHVQVKWADPVSNDFGEAYMKAIDSVKDRAPKLWSSRIPMMIQAYFEDLAAVLSLLYRSAARGASAWFVVSTSAYAGVEIPVDEILAEVAERQGWTIRRLRFLRHLERVANQQWGDLLRGSERAQLRETIVILDKK